jgi:hypothetical protein
LRGGMNIKVYCSTLSGGTAGTRSNAAGPYADDTNLKSGTIIGGRSLAYPGEDGIDKAKQATDIFEADGHKVWLYNNHKTLDFYLSSRTALESNCNSAKIRRRT